MYFLARLRNNRASSELAEELSELRDEMICVGVISGSILRRAPVEIYTSQQYCLAPNSLKPLKILQTSCRVNAVGNPSRDCGRSAYTDSLRMAGVVSA